MTYSENRPTGQRLEYVDCAKALGIFCVVYAHTQLDESVQNFIYVFHMPLFFFVSGYLFSYQSNTNGTLFLKKRTRQLVAPYVAINIVTYLFWLLVGRKVGADSGMATDALSPLRAAVLCDGPNMVHDVPLWFLFCLFVIEIVYYPLFRRKATKQRFAIIATFVVLAVANYLFNPQTLPFSLGTALMGMVFYAVGHETRLHGMRFNNVLVAVVSLAIMAYISFANGRINMHKNYYANVALFLTGAFAGIYAVMTLCRHVANAITHMPRMRHAIRFVSDNTLLICGYHLLCFSFLKGILVYGCHVDLRLFDSTVVPNLLFAIAAMTLCLAMIYIYGKLRRRAADMNLQNKCK